MFSGSLLILHTPIYLNIVASLSSPSSCTLCFLYDFVCFFFYHSLLISLCCSFFLPRLSLIVSILLNHLYQAYVPLIPSLVLSLSSFVRLHSIYQFLAHAIYRAFCYSSLLN